MIHKIHQTPEEQLANSGEKSRELLQDVNQKLNELKEAIESISITKEIKIDFSETNNLLKKLTEREDEPVKVSVKLNIL